jgi:general secretion pathway protein L
MYYQQYLIIDYGTTHIKGILFRNSLGTVSILRRETLPIVHLVDSEEDEYEYNIVRFTQSFFPEEKNLILNIPTEKVIIRDVSLTLDNEKTIRAVVPTEVENLLPYPMEVMTTKFCIWKIENENSRTITFNVHNNDLSITAEPLIKNESQIQSIYTDLFSLSCLLRQRYHKASIVTDEKLAQLDIGGRISILNFCLNGKVFFSRYFPIGGETITKAISKKLDLSYSEAEAIKVGIDFDITEPQEEIVKKYKKQFGLNNEQYTIVIDCIVNVIRTLSAEVRRSLLVVEPKLVPTQVYLSGGSSSFPGLSKILSEKISLPCTYYDFVELEEFGSNKNIYAVCLGENFHKKLKKNDRVDFLTDQISKKISASSFQIGKFKPHLAISSISLILLLIVFSVGIYNDKKKLQAQKESLRSKFQQGFGRALTDEEDAISAATMERNKEKKRSEIVRLFLSKEGILDLILEANNRFPTKEELDFVLDQFSFDADSIQIYGRVNEYSEIGIIQSALEKSSKFKNIEVMNKRLITGVAKFKVSFKIKMDLKTAGKE